MSNICSTNLKKIYKSVKEPPLLDKQAKPVTSTRMALVSSTLFYL